MVIQKKTLYYGMPKTMNKLKERARKGYTIIIKGVGNKEVKAYTYRNKKRK